MSFIQFLLKLSAPSFWRELKPSEECEKIDSANVTLVVVLLVIETLSFDYENKIEYK